MDLDCDVLTSMDDQPFRLLWSVSRLRGTDEPKPLGVGAQGRGC